MMYLCLVAAAFPDAALGYREREKREPSMSLLRRELSKAVLGLTILMGPTERVERRGRGLEVGRWVDRLFRKSYLCVRASLT